MPLRSGGNLRGVCEKTVTNLLKAGLLPEPCWLNSIPVWILYDIHAFLSAAAGKPRDDSALAETVDASTDAKHAKRSAHKAGKYSA